MPEKLLSPREVGTRLGFKRTKVYELLSSGAPPFPVLRFNARVVRVREADLDSWITAGCPLPADVGPSPAKSDR